MDRWKAAIGELSGPTGQWQSFLGNKTSNDSSLNKRPGRKDTTITLPITKAEQ